jgi:hypothetical protein
MDEKITLSGAIESIANTLRAHAPPCNVRMPLCKEVEFTSEDVSGMTDLSNRERRPFSLEAP